MQKTNLGNKQETKIVNIDATGISLGRLASQIAVILNGKTTIDFVKNKISDVKVIVTNAGKLRVTGKKMSDSVHKNYSGYPGGLKQEPLKRVVEKHGFAQLIKHAVSGMLPKNKLQDKRLMNLEITE
jgi:large subunit ribosomal protein L13